MTPRNCPYCGELTPGWTKVRGIAVYKCRPCERTPDAPTTISWFAWLMGRSFPLDDLGGHVGPEVLKKLLEPRFAAMKGA
jgi:hypothetical protein